MQSKELLRIHLDLTLDFVLPLIEELEDHLTVFPTPNGGNHPLWVLGHSTYAESGIVHEKMFGKPHPFPEWRRIFGDGTEPVSDADRYPVYAEVMTKCYEVRKETLSLLDSMNEVQLDTVCTHCDPNFIQFWGTYRLCFLFIANHWMMHRGQVADARRAAGLANYG